MTGRVQISESLAGTGVKRAWIEATVIRADGRIEPLGIIADTTNPSFFKKIGAKLWRNR